MTVQSRVIIEGISFRSDLPLNHCPCLLSFLQAVRLESAYPQVTRYMVVVSTNGRQDTEESIVLGMDFVSSDRSVPHRQYTRCDQNL